MFLRLTAAIVAVSIWTAVVFAPCHAEQPYIQSSITNIDNEADIVVPEPIAVPEPVVVADPSQAGLCQATAEPCQECGCCCEGLLRGCCNAARTMYPHYPYYPPMHGYYYFRPYHHSHLAEQASFASSWGADPYNPYSSTVFQKVYAEYRAAHAGDPAVPAVDPAAPPEILP